MLMVGVVIFIFYLLISFCYKEWLVLLEFDCDVIVFYFECCLCIFWVLWFGLLFLFGGVGLLFGYLVYWIFGILEELVIFVFLFIVVGGGLFIYFFIGLCLERYD